MRAPTSDQIDEILALLRGGADLETVLAHLGVPLAEFDTWLRKPRNRRVAEKLARAQAQADLQDMAIIRNAAQTRADAAAGTWQAAKAQIEFRGVRARERELLEWNAVAGA